MIVKTDTFIELELHINSTKVGFAEVNPVKNELTRFVIYEPYQGKGYGHILLQEIIDEYEISNLWVNSDNLRAIHLYKKFGFKRKEDTMFRMERGDE